MTRLAITVFHSFISKNILQTEVFSVLKKCEDIDITLLVPLNKEVFFRQLFPGERIKIYPIDVDQISNTKRFRIMLSASKLLQVSHYNWYKRVEQRNRRHSLVGYAKYVFEGTVIALFAGRAFARRLLRRVFRVAGGSADVKKLFDDICPDIVFSTDVFDERDLLVSREARIQGVPIIGMVRSWDNCWSKGILRVIPERLIVNTPTIKEEAVSFHDVPAEHVFVGGVPQYDTFFSPPAKNRAEFMREIGAKDSDKLIVFAPAGTILSDTDAHICEIIDRARREGAFGQDVFTLVRNHPNHPANLSAYEERPGMNVENPGKAFGGSIKDAELTGRDIAHLKETLSSADVIVYTATTLGLDSLPYDKPQVIIDFDGFDSKPYTKSVRRYHNEDHMKKMIALGGVTVAESADKLVAGIKDALHNPLRLKSGRDAMRAQQLFFTDGASGRRIGEYVAKEARALVGKS